MGGGACTIMGAGGGVPMLTFTCTWAPADVANSACNSITHSSMLNFVRAIRMICRLKVTPLFSPAYEKSQPLLSSFNGRSSNLLEATHWPLFMETVLRFAIPSPLYLFLSGQGLRSHPDG